jgi:hypothetical protein
VLSGSERYQEDDHAQTPLTRSIRLAYCCANALGLDVPRILLKRATQVID